MKFLLIFFSERFQLFIVFAVNKFGRHNNCLLPSFWLLSRQFCRRLCKVASVESGLNHECFWEGFQASKVYFDKRKK